MIFPYIWYPPWLAFSMLWVFILLFYFFLEEKEVDLGNNSKMSYNTIKVFFIYIENIVLFKVFLRQYNWPYMLLFQGARLYVKHSLFVFIWTCHFVRYLGFPFNNNKKKMPSYICFNWLNTLCHNVFWLGIRVF